MTVDSARDLMDVYVKHIFGSDQLTLFFSLDSLRNLEHTIIAVKARVVIIDSIASLFRKEFGSGSLVERTDMLASIASLLKYFIFGFPEQVFAKN